MRPVVAVAAALVISGCGQKTEQPQVSQSRVTEKPAAEENSGEASSNEPAAAPTSPDNAPGALPPTESALRFVGRWARDKASCSTKPWTFTSHELSATDGPHCSIYNVKKVPGGYDLAVQCPAKKPDPTDLIKLRFAESARAMLVESNAISPMGLIYCGK